RAGPPVARPTPICFSPNSAPPAGAAQSSGRGQRIVIDSPLLAQPAVGSESIQYVSATALGAASTERPPNAGAQDSVAPSAQDRCRLLASGLSDALVATIQSARAVSTRALYTLKWCSLNDGVLRVSMTPLTARWALFSNSYSSCLMRGRRLPLSKCTWLPFQPAMQALMAVLLAVTRASVTLYGGGEMAQGTRETPHTLLGSASGVTCSHRASVRAPGDSGHKVCLFKDCAATGVNVSKTRW